MHRRALSQIATATSFVTLCWLVACSSDTKTEQAPTEVATEVENDIARTAALMRDPRYKECMATKAVIVAHVEKFLAEGSLLEAANEAEPCALRTEDRELTALYRRARLQLFTGRVSNTLLPLDLRLAAFEALHREHAAEAQSVLAMYSHLREDARRQAEDLAAAIASNATREKAYQVQIAKQRLARLPPQLGMTKDEAIESAWKRPHRINITRSASGDTEQWVYEGKGYVYFRGDRVAVVQEVH